MAKFKIQQDRDQCIACGACWTTCPAFWEQSDDGKSTLKGNSNNALDIEEKDLECNKKAAESCPVKIIHITNAETGEKVV